METFFTDLIKIFLGFFDVLKDVWAWLNTPLTFYILDVDIFQEWFGSSLTPIEMFFGGGFILILLIILIRAVII